MSEEIKTYTINGYGEVPEEEWFNLLSYLEESGITHTGQTEDHELTESETYALFDKNSDGLISDADLNPANSNLTQFAQVKDILKKYGIQVEENEMDPSSQTAIENTVHTFHEIFELAGLDSLRLEVMLKHGYSVYYLSNSYPPFVRLSNDSYDKHEFHYFMRDFSRHLNANHCKACSNDEKFFYQLNEDWVLVHFEDENEPDRILHLFPDGWKHITTDLAAKEFSGNRFNELATILLILQHKAPVSQGYDEPPVSTKIDSELLAFLETDWDDFSLSAPAQDFVDHLYAFELKNDTDTLPFISPFHQITLAGHPDTVIPWNDPYLLIEWESHLKQAGFEIEESESGTKKYFFKSFLVMESTRTSDEIKFQLFSPAGEIEQETTVNIPTKPEVTVTLPDDPDETFHSISVYGRQLEVEAYFPDEWTQEQRVHQLKTIGEALQEIPESMLAPILDGAMGERPLRLRLSDKEKAREKGWTSRDAGGNYDASANDPWLLLGSSRGTVFHEVGGHALADISIAGSPSDYGADARYLTSPDHSDLRDYYAWKLFQIFSPEELATYSDLSTLYRKWEADFSRNKENGPEMIEHLEPFREKALTRFVSAYAAEGSEGIKKHLREPHEDFAEVMKTFFECLTGTKDWESYRSREPLLDLVALNYLFTEYGVSTIGQVNREDIFSRDAFREVLDIELDDVYNKEYTTTRLPIPKDPDRMAFTMPFEMGFGGVSLIHQEERMFEPGTSFIIDVRLQPGISGKKGGGGGSISFSVGGPSIENEDSTGQFYDILDLGVWGQITKEIGPNTLLFFEPEAGMRNMLGGVGQENDYSLWMGGKMVLGNRSAGFFLDGKLGVSNSAQWISLGAGFRLDPVSFER